VIGLDSNDVSSGPNSFPVGTRICNTGSSDATNVAATFTWDTSNAYISLGDAASQSVGTIAAGSCRDVYFTAVVTRSSSAYDQTRRFHVTASADSIAPVSSPTPRELYVEHLVSQNRNATLSFSGPTSVQVGQTVTYTVTTKTATGGYEQLEAFSSFPTSMFRVVSTASAYSAPSGATNDKLYADACGWDAVPTSGTYRSCIGPEGYSGGKAGGNPITTVYTLEVIGTGSATVGTLIYDFSGSSYHYNSDFGNSVTVTSTAPSADLSVGIADSPDPVSTGGSLAYTLSVANAGPSDASSLTLTANLPAGTTFVSASGTGWTCGEASGAVTCTRSALASGTSAPNVTLDVTAPSTPGTITLTASIASATTDGNAANDSDSENTTVSAGNSPPVAVDDTATTSVGTPVDVSVLLNDSDPDGDTLTITGSTSGANGAVSCTTSVCTYTPDPGFTGTDTFTYIVSDGQGGSDTATVTITVSAAPNTPPDAVDDSTSTAENASVDVDVLANDTDADGDTLVVSASTQPANGTVSCTTTTCTYVPTAGFTGTDSFTYTISDGRGGTDTATVTVTVSAPPNTPPTAADDVQSTVAGTPVDVNVLGNDTDPDGDTLTITGSTNGANGTVSCTASVCTYTPDPGFTGTDTFTYTISDGNGGTDSAIVTITVDPGSPPVDTPPDAVDDSASTTAGTGVLIDPLANDTDADGDPIQIDSSTQPGDGSVLCTASQCTYVPDAGFTGTDTFTYTISDGRGGTDTATVTVTVSPAPNGAPVAVDDTATTTAGVAKTISVLANDTDPDGDPLTISAFTQPSSGSVTCTTTQCAFVPASGFSGTTTFTYTIADGRGGVDTATVTVTVSGSTGGGGGGGGDGGGSSSSGSSSGSAGPANRAPTAVDDTASTAQGSPVTIAVLGNDTDPDGDPLTITSYTQPSSGTVTCTATDCTFTPVAGFSGTATFTYTVGDGKGGTDTAIVTITIAKRAGGGGGGGTPAPERRAVLVASKTPDAAVVTAGRTVTYRIVVHNTGRGAARDVVVCDVPSDTLAFVSAPGATFVRGQACWRIRTLAPGAKRTFHVTTKVDATAAGRVVNVLVVGSHDAGERVRARAGVRVKESEGEGRGGGVTG
jgi:uncharacterized repeat protein (TIGR01451 family)